MAIPERDTIYTTESNRVSHHRESSGTGWFVGIIVVLALLAIGYLVFSANSGSSTATTTSGTPALESGVTPMTDAGAAAPVTDAPTTTTQTVPVTEAPADAAAPAVTAPVEEPAV